jgi:hypothetical protein
MSPDGWLIGIYEYLCNPVSHWKAKINVPPAVKAWKSISTQFPWIDFDFSWF